MEAAAHVAASGLDAYRYATATHAADLLFWEAVADRARELRMQDMAEAFGRVM